VTRKAKIRLLRSQALQLEVLQHPARFKVLACGRRFGKTETGKIAAVETAARGGVAWYIARNYGQSVEVWDSFKATLHGIARKKEVDRLLTLPGGGEIRVRSANDPDALRGSGLDLAILDEAAHMPAEVWQAAIRPALADRQGSALFFSTPNGKNWFFDLWVRGQDPLQPDWQSWHFPTSASPTVQPGEIEAARAELPDHWFKQEFLAEFTDDAGTVFRNLAAVCVGQPQEPTKGHLYVFGVDFARHNDFSCIAVYDVTTARMVYLDRFNQVDWTLQRGRLTALARRYAPAEIVAEANSIGEPNIEELTKEGLPMVAFTTTAASKGPLIDALSLAIERGDVTLLDDPVLRGELEAYTIERLPSGHYRYSAPPGGHDDTVMAAALGWHGVKGRLNYSPQVIRLPFSGLYNSADKRNRIKPEPRGASAPRADWWNRGKVRPRS